MISSPTVRFTTKTPVDVGFRVSIALALTLAILCGCAPPLQAVPVAPDVDYAAHVDHRGLVIDEMPGASPAILESAAWHPWSDGPQFLLRAHGRTIAALWHPEAGKMLVRKTSDPQSPLIGEVDATWRHGAIRLTFKPADGVEVQTGEFDRIDGRFSTVALSSQATTVLDVRGVYRADLHDATGAPAGWLRVQVSPYQGASRIYDGVVPASLNGPLATAAMALVDSDVNDIEDHAINVYVGN